MEHKISVIVPVYNVEKYLARCIDSIINQTYRNLEIIIVDDGSPDQCPSICEEYVKIDSRVKVIHQKNAGLSSARNAGIDTATGDYIAFVDADDYINHKMYEVLMQYCLREKADLAICKYLKFYGDYVSEKIEINGSCKTQGAYESLLQLHGYEGEVYCVAWNKLYKKELFQQLRYPIGKINEDEFITYKIIDQANKVVLVEDILYYYFQGNVGSITNDARYLATTDILEAFEERDSYYKLKGYEELIKMTQRPYLDKVMQIYRNITKTGCNDKKLKNRLTTLYRKRYKTNNCEALGEGYKLFYLSPGLYRIIKGILTRNKEQSSSMST